MNRNAEKPVMGAVGLSGCTHATAGTVTQVPYGELRDGSPVTQTCLRSDAGIEVRFLDYGAAITDILVPDRNGKKVNVNLSLPNLDDLEAKNDRYLFGAIVGRYAGRIAGARFSLDGRTYRLTANEGINTVHGGGSGFHTKVWNVVPFQIGKMVGAVLSYSSPAGEQGFPGRLDVTVTYSLTSDHDLQIDYDVRTDAATVFNLTNHAYFNLAGAGSGSVLDHQWQVFADRYVEVGEDSIPTGVFRTVADTPFDFRTPASFASKIDHPLVGHRGYNHSWILPDQRGDVVKLAGRLVDRASGRTLEVLTTEPSIHAYTAGYFSGEDKGPTGAHYRQYDAVALETQHVSNAPNDPRLPSTVLRPGQVSQSTTIYRFGVQG